MCCHKKGLTFKLENKDGYHFFPVSEGAGVHTDLSLYNAMEVDSPPDFGSRIKQTDSEMVNVIVNESCLSNLLFTFDV